MAGRITFAKSVIEAIPIYPMMSNVVPKACIKEIQKLQRNFVWGDTDVKKKMHAVGWETVLRRKEQGGLGLRDLELMNQACIMKLSWKMMNQSSDLWCKVLRSKYQMVTFSHDSKGKSMDSHIWRAIVKFMPKLLDESIWRIGNGESIHAWNDNWIEPGKNIAEYGLDIPSELYNAKVCDLVTVHVEWNWEILDSWIPTELHHAIEAVLPPIDQEIEDSLRIVGTKDGGFSVSHMYQKLQKPAEDGNNDIWRIIWKLKTPERVKVFIWLLAHDRLMTNHRKSTCGIGYASCQLCGDVCETTLHALRNCPIARRTWEKIVPTNLQGFFFAGNFQDWISGNLTVYGAIENWRNTWAIRCHALWTWRNKDIHVDDHARPYFAGRNIVQRRIDYEAAKACQHSIIDTQRLEEKISWIAPDSPFIKLNVDGSSDTRNLSGCGGIIRDHKGNWICGFSKYIGICDTFTTEVWGVYEGLKITSARGFGKVIINTDSKRVLHAILQEGNNGDSDLALIRRIRFLMEKHDAIRIEHTFREANRVADELAKAGRLLKLGYKFYDEAPDCIKKLLQDDSLNLTVSRIVVV